MAETSEDEILARIQRSEREELRIAVSTFNGYKYVGLRVWAICADGVMRPIKAKGCTIRVAEIGRAIEALEQARQILSDLI